MEFACAATATDMVEQMTKMKDEGNKHFSAGNYAAAAECYSKGLTIWEDAPADARITMGSGFPQIPVMQIVVEYADIGNILRNNRAACYLKLGLFLEAARDAHVAAESIRGMWAGKHYDASPAYEHHYRRTGKADDMHLKGRSRASRAFAAMGNTARALEELEWLEWHRAFIELGPGAPAAKLRTNPFNLPGDVATELRDLRSVEHPNIKLVQKTKVDWRGCVAGTWRKVATKGPCPLPLHSASVTYYNGKVFLFGGSNPNRFRHNGTMWILELSSYTWREASMKGLPSSKEESVRYEETASVVWRGHAYFWSGGTCVLQYDLAHEAWQVRQSTWPKNALGRAVFATRDGEGKLLDFAAVAARGKMYVYGGATRGKHVCVGHLMCLDLTTFKWEVLHNGGDGITSAATPEARYCSTMWAADEKLWIFGGRIDRWLHATPPIEDYTLTQDRFLYCWDLDTNTWSESGRMTYEHMAGNPPCGRSEVAMALATKADGDAMAAVFGGYTTFVRHHPDPRNLALVHGFQYLADTFIFDVAKRRWSMVYCDSWPTHRAGASMVFVPDHKGDGSSSSKSGSSSKVTGAGAASKGGSKGGRSSSGGGRGTAERGSTSTNNIDSSKDDDAGATKRAKGLVPGKFLMLGGYLGGHSLQDSATGATDPDDPNTVWELKLDAHPKRVKAVCHGCGKFNVAMKQCTGSCGGAVIVCGPACHKKVWDAGHRLWCKKKAA